ncbi:MAG TPA: transaminase [Actinomycetes bacterium]|nr:transaminase [Actinomycetes bacterium]
MDRDRLAGLLGRERDRFLERHPRSRAAYRAAGASLLGGVPMTWMNKAAGGFPVYLAEARGATVTDLDGHRYVDLCLGDTAAMAGHSPEPTVRAVQRRYAELGGATAMLPTEDAAWVGAELARRFGVPLWSFSLTATDANRWAIRLARLVTGRPKLLVFNYCYHGTVDEAFVTLDRDGLASRQGNVGPPVDPTTTTRVVEFNDLDALDRELAAGDVACVLMEPAMTNIGIVLPAPGYLEGVRQLTRRHGALLVNDETHTLSAGPGGCTLAWSLEPDMVTVGKAIAGGIAAGAYGVSAEVAERVAVRRDADLVDTGGVGGTLAGNALSVAAMRATLEHVLTAKAFEAMIALAGRFTEGVQGVLEACRVPWSVVQLGARAEYRFTAPAPVNGGQSAAAGDDQLDDLLHLYLHNRGVLLTPFHNMALMCPATTAADVDRHTEVFGAAVAELVSDGA